MSKFLYAVQLPVSNKVISLTELSYIELRGIVKNIANENNNIIANVFEETLQSHCSEDITDLTAIDKLFILLTIRSVCVSPLLELAVTCPETKKQFNYNQRIDNILNILRDNIFPEETKTYDKGMTITYCLPKSLYLNQDILDTVETVINNVSLNGHIFYNITAEMVNKLPAVVLNDVNTYAIRVYERLKNIELLNISSPYALNNTATVLTANVFDNSVIEFLKLCYNRDLMSLYKIEYFLMKQFRMSFETMQNLTIAEINVYINLFKEEQEEQEKAEKQQASGASPMPTIGSAPKSGGIM
jgi:uncharacterized alkaline shock family protein YloU